ncbi:MAG TPA: hypothetical protein P5107_10135 [Thermotogota bacterium]|nr:hypothetical protein [Thermotogota bacterium]HRW35401.1 hypothetical protein [Thermotogota bacterium]
MSTLEKTTFICCSLCVLGWMAFALFFTQPYQQLEILVKNNIAYLESWRLSYNGLISNLDQAFKLSDEEVERVINTAYTLIYKKEYEALKDILQISEQMETINNIPIGALINTVGSKGSQILHVASMERIPQKGFLVSPSRLTVIGKIISSNGKTAEVMPIWNDQFSAQVVIKDEIHQQQYSDLALIENNQVINFNPAFPYRGGEGVYISEYESGGYILSRYNWTKIGKIVPIKQNEMVEKYAIQYNFSNEDFLQERYFLIVE